MNGAPLPGFAVTRSVMGDDRRGCVNDDGDCGVVRRDPEDARQLAAALEQFVGDTCWTRKMGRAVRERAGPLTWQRPAGCYLALDEEVARRDGARTQCAAKFVVLGQS